MCDGDDFVAQAAARLAKKKPLLFAKHRLLQENDSGTGGAEQSPRWQPPRLFSEQQPRVPVTFTFTAASPNVQYVSLVGDFTSPAPWKARGGDLRILNGSHA